MIGQRWVALSGFRRRGLFRFSEFVPRLHVWWILSPWETNGGEERERRPENHGVGTGNGRFSAAFSTQFRRDGETHKKVPLEFLAASGFLFLEYPAFFQRQIRALRSRIAWIEAINRAHFWLIKIFTIISQSGYFFTVSSLKQKTKRGRKKEDA